LFFLADLQEEAGHHREEAFVVAGVVLQEVVLEDLLDHKEDLLGEVLQEDELLLVGDIQDHLLAPDRDLLLEEGREVIPDQLHVQEVPQRKQDEVQVQVLAAGVAVEVEVEVLAAGVVLCPRKKIQRNEI